MGIFINIKFDYILIFKLIGLMTKDTKPSKKKTIHVALVKIFKFIKAVTDGQNVKSNNIASSIAWKESLKI